MRSGARPAWTDDAIVSLRTMGFADPRAQLVCAEELGELMGMTRTGAYSFIIDQLSPPPRRVYGPFGRVYWFREDVERAIKLRKQKGRYTEEAPENAPEQRPSEGDNYDAQFARLIALAEETLASSRTLVQYAMSQAQYGRRTCTAVEALASALSAPVAAKVDRPKTSPAEESH